MGWNEDDRIRNKNRSQNDAIDLYEGLKMMGYDNAAIIKYIEFAQTNCTDPTRIKVLDTIISIVRSFDEKGNTTK